MARRDPIGSKYMCKGDTGGQRVFLATLGENGHDLKDV